MRALYILALLTSVCHSFAQIDTTDLLFYMKFDETFNDASANQIQVENYDLTFVEDRFRNPNSAILSDYGQNKYLSITDTILFQDFKKNDFTISIWIKYNWNYSIGTIFRLDDFSIDNNQYITFGRSLNSENTNFRPDLAIWNHFIWQTSGDSISEIFNGVLINKIPRNNPRWQYGIRNNNYFLLKDVNGSLDDLIIFKRELSENEILALYNNSPIITAATELDPAPFFQNPLNGTLKIPTNVTSVNIFDLSGKSIATSEKSEISTNNIQPGIYILEYKTNKHQVYREKIVIE